MWKEYFQVLHKVLKQFLPQKTQILEKPQEFKKVMILCSLKGLVLMVLIREKVENIVVFVRGNFQIKKVWK